MTTEQRPVRRLTILHVSEVHWGGVVTLLRHFADGQDRAGHDVHLLAPEGVGHIRGARQWTWRFERRRPWQLPRAWWQLRRVIHQVRPDVVHVHSFVAGFIVRMCARRWLGLRGAVVYQPHAWSYDLVPNRVFGFAVRWWERFAGRRTDLLVANCEDEIAEGRQLGLTLPARAVSVAVDLDAFAPVPESHRTTARQELGIEGGHVALLVGRISRQKGHDLLVPAWEHQPPGDGLLLLVGPGATEQLREEAPKEWGHTIIAVGEQSDVRPWLWASDVVIMASRYEGFPLVIAEAMACGRPLVVTAINGARWSITDGPLARAGDVVDLGDMAGLLASTHSLLTDDEQRRQASEAARARAVALFSPDDVVTALEQAYFEAIAIRERLGR